MQQCSASLPSRRFYIFLLPLNNSNGTKYDTWGTLLWHSCKTKRGRGWNCCVPGEGVTIHRGTPPASDRKLHDSLRSKQLYCVSFPFGVCVESTRLFRPRWVVHLHIELLSFGIRESKYWRWIDSVSSSMTDYFLILTQLLNFLLTQCPHLVTEIQTTGSKAAGRLSTLNKSSYSAE